MRHRQPSETAEAGANFLRSYEAPPRRETRFAGIQETLVGTTGCQLTPNSPSTYSTTPIQQTISVTSTDKIYARYLKRIGDITVDRDQLASQIKTVLNNAAFHNQAVGEGAEDGLGHRAKALIDQVKNLAEHDQD